MKRQLALTWTLLYGRNFYITRTVVRRCLPLAAAFILACSFSIEATPVYFLNDPVAARSSFRAAASGPLALESFESSFSTGMSVSFPVGGPYAFTVSSSAVGGIIGQESFSRGVTDGSYAMAINEDPPGLTLTFDFTSPITAFGLDVNDLNFATMSFGDNLGNMNMDVLVGDNGGPGFQNLQFFGVVNSTAFSTVQLGFVNPTSFTGTIFLDRLEFTPVPEPPMYGVIIAGALLAVVAQKRKSTSEMPNKITAPNAGEPRQFPIRTLQVARVDEF